MTVKKQGKDNVVWRRFIEEVLADIFNAIQPPLALSKEVEKGLMDGFTPLQAMR